MLLRSQLWIHCIYAVGSIDIKGFFSENALDSLPRPSSITNNTSSSCQYHTTSSRALPAASSSKEAQLRNSSPTRFTLKPPILDYAELMSTIFVLTRLSDTRVLVLYAKWVQASSRLRLAPALVSVTPMKSVPTARTALKVSAIHLEYVPLQEANMPNRLGSILL